MKTLVPPIKCQGIKTKLVPWIRDNVDWNERGRWIEPFMGSGVAGFNLAPRKALFADSNPHLIAFYQAIRDGAVTAESARVFLEKEGRILHKKGKSHYYRVRERFNRRHAPLDFLFLNRACFNGLMRFNRRGAFNVPFCRNPERFSAAYVTRIVNQIRNVTERIEQSDWTFVHRDFRRTLRDVEPDDFVYCDPPYIGRHTGYFDLWGAEGEVELLRLLARCPARFVLSTWSANIHRENAFLTACWSEFHVLEREHFYHVGARERNRKPMTEALVLNYDPPAPMAPGATGEREHTAPNGGDYVGAGPERGPS